MELTVEVSCCKRPPVQSLARHWRHNYHSMLAVLVLDTRGFPVCGAQVMVEGVDKVTVTSERGEYWRLLLPGQYRILSRAGTSSGSTTVFICQSLGQGSVRADIVLDQQEELSTARQLG